MVSVWVQLSGVMDSLKKWSPLTNPRCTGCRTRKHSCRLLPCDVWWGMAGDDKLPKSPYMIHHVVCYHVTYDGGWRETTNYQSLHTWFIMSSVTMWRMMEDGGRRQTTKVSIHDSSCRLLPCDVWWGMAGDDKLPKSPYMIHHVVCYHVTYDGGWRETTNYQRLHTWFIMSSVTMWRMMGDGGRRQTTKVSIHDSSCRLLPCDVWWGMAGDDKLPKSPYMIHHVVCYHVTYDGGWRETTNYQSLHTWFIMSSVTMWRMMGDGGRRQTTNVSIHDSSCRLLPCDVWWGMAGDDKLLLVELFGREEQLLMVFVCCLFTGRHRRPLDPRVHLRWPDEDSVMALRDATTSGVDPALRDCHAAGSSYGRAVV